MPIYQVIKNEYDSDDGHYDHDPVDDIVYEREVDAVNVRDGLNAKAIREHNDKIAEHARGHTKAYQSEWVEYARRNTYRGAVDDVEAIESFASGRSNCLTYYTIQKLRLFK